MLVRSEYPSAEARRGDERLCRAWISHLAQENEVDLLCFGGRRDERASGDEIFRKIYYVPRPRGGFFHPARARFALKYPAAAANHSPALAERLVELAARERYDLVQFDGFEMGLYVRLLPREQRRALFLNAIEGNVLRQTIRIASGLKKIALYREWKKTARWEKWFSIRAGNVLVTSLPDKRIVDSWDIGVRTFVLPPVLDEDTPRIEAAAKGRPDIVFEKMTRPDGDRDALDRLRREIMPRVAAQYPGLRLVIAGGQLPDGRRASGNDNFSVISRSARIEGPERRPEILAAPLRVAGGIIVKILEAISAGLPVVASRAAVSAIGAPEEEAILLADRADLFARQLVRLLEDSNLRERLRKGGKKWLRKRFDPGRCRREVDRIYAVCAGNEQ